MPVPLATYRIQLRPEFDFEAAAEIVPYLGALGVSHLYASPYLQAAPGSTHGYDVVDPTRVSRELGGDGGRVRLQEALAAAGLGQVLDVVPNHMAIAPGNRWWWDVLRNGPAGRYAPFFDVDWDPPEPKLRNRVLMPILGDHYGREVESGAIRLGIDEGEITVRYHEHVLPVSPRAAGWLVVAAARRVGTDDRVSPASRVRARELAFLGRVLQDLPAPGGADDRQRERRRQDLQVLDARVPALIREDPVLASALKAEVEAVNGDPAALERVLDAQSYRLAYWRAADQELDYRRFFDIDSLAALRTEDETVFREVHHRVLEWLRAGSLDGVRVDHPDGLRRPAEYFRRLKSAAPDAWIVAEKILMPGEPLPEWPVDGTTGYDFLNDVTRVFLDPRGEGPLTELWRELSGDDRDYGDVARDARREVIRDVLAADLNRLANIFVHLCETRSRYRDFTRRELRDALAEVAACFPVYRTYVGEDGEASARDRDVVRTAVASAAGRRPDLDPELLELLRAVLVGEVTEPEARGLRMRFQQFTGPVAAKGEEDTAFYRYNRFVALNEVGGDPGHWSLSAEAFHDRCRRRAVEQPATMNALSTHDTKRSEDVRARLLVLAEVPDRWTAAVRRWRESNGDRWPSAVPAAPGVEYLLYQTLVGAWPIGVDRVIRYMEKAVREAKVRTSWTTPDEAFEAALSGFVRELLSGPFEEEVARFVAPLEAPGRVVSLSQKLVQLTAPGVPDLYQGTELWDLSLVDPDNRRPVDFARRLRLLARLPAPTGEVVAAMDDGLPKLWVATQALRTRRDRAAAFAGPYTALSAEGPAAEHVLGFVRGGEVAVIVPRFPVRLVRDGGWRSTTVALPAGRWVDVLTGAGWEGGPIEAASVFRLFPVALLVRGRT